MMSVEWWMREVARRIARQVRIAWGDQSMSDRRERALRVLEEALELAQAEGVDAGHASSALIRVYNRPAGEPRQEAAGLMITLLAWSESSGIWLQEVTEEELERFEQRVASPGGLEDLRQRHRDKLEAGLSYVPVPR